MNIDSTNTSGMIYVCDSNQLTNGDFKRVGVIFQGVEDSVIVLRNQGELKAYRNLCVHMPRSLDCESAHVFDKHSGYLRCSMHGIVYSPETGESLSDICHGKKLTAVRVLEVEQCVYIKDKRVKPLE